MPMEIDYDWKFRMPGDALNVHMNDLHRGQKMFDATLTLRRREISSRSLARALLHYPVMTLQVVTFIHWQALRLWVKGATFYVHPDKRSTA
jgi:hypothetical protein